MGIYAYLVSKEKNLTPFPQDATRWDRFCVWLVKDVFGTRYWREVAYLQVAEMSAYKKAYRESSKAKEVI